MQNALMGNTGMSNAHLTHIRTNDSNLLVFINLQLGRHQTCGGPQGPQQHCYHESTTCQLCGATQILGTIICFRCQRQIVDDETTKLWWDQMRSQHVQRAAYVAPPEGIAINPNVNATGPRVRKCPNWDSWTEGKYREKAKRYATRAQKWLAGRQQELPKILTDAQQQYDLANNLTTEDYRKIQPRDWTILRFVQELSLIHI